VTESHADGAYHDAVRWVDGIAVAVPDDVAQTKDVTEVGIVDRCQVVCLPIDVAKSVFEHLLPGACALRIRGLQLVSIQRESISDADSVLFGQRR